MMQTNLYYNTYTSYGVAAMLMMESTIPYARL